MGLLKYKKYIRRPWEQFSKLRVSSKLTLQPQQLDKDVLSGNFLDFVESELAKTPFKVLVYKLPEGDQFFNLNLYRNEGGFCDHVFNRQTIIYEKQVDCSIYRNFGPEKEKSGGHSAKSILASGNSQFHLNVDTARVKEYNEKMEQILQSAESMSYGVGGKLDLNTFKGDNFKNWNLQTLDNPLRDADQMPGINQPGAIFSPQGTITAMHTEDHDLMSINIMVPSEMENPEKVEIKEWLVIVPSKKNLKKLKKLLNGDILKFEMQDFKCGVSQYDEEPKYCEAAYRQKRFAVTMKTLHDNRIEFRVVKQTPGIMVITSENLFHQILNVTRNRTFSVNCMGKFWRSRRVKLCLCAHTGEGFERRHGQIIPCFTTDKLIKQFNNRRAQAACDTENPKNCSAESSTSKEIESPPTNEQQSTSSKTIRQKTVVCKVCKKEFYNISARNQHFRGTHEDKRFQCSACNTLFARESQLKAHVLSMHLRVQIHTCDTCGRKFRHYSSKRDHVCTMLCD